MRKNLLIYSLLCLLACVPYACKETDPPTPPEVVEPGNTEPGNVPEPGTDPNPGTDPGTEPGAEPGAEPGEAPSYEMDPKLFPKEDGSVPLTGPSSAKIWYLVQKMDTKLALTPDPALITSAEFKDLQDFVTQNLKGATGAETYQNIFKWVTGNLKYGAGDLRPYDVFKNRKCICQGYANLLKTMMQTQGYPAFGGNGLLLEGSYDLAHAWVYTYDGSKWWMSDPTNGVHYGMSEWDNEKKGYTRYVAPQLADIPLFQDEHFAYGYQENALNVNEVKSGASAVVVLPYSVAGYIISCFSLQKPLPKEVKVLYVGKNIQAFSPYMSTFQDYTPGLERVYVDPEHPVFKTYKGIIYEGNANLPYYIPTAIKKVELKSIERMEKNTIINLPQVEEIVLGQGTRVVEAYAIENCPQLQRVYVPEGAKVESNAVYKCHPKVEIIYGRPE